MATAKLSIAVDRKGREKETDFFDAVAFGKNADFACTYLKKGQLVGVVGSLRMRQYTAKDGTNKKVVEINIDKIDALTWPKADGEHAPAKQTVSNDDIEDPFA
jgi:single-strand DNA-binding protein